MMSGEEYLPKFWTKKEDIPDEAFPIVCRTVLSGHSGVGIVIADNRDDLVPANLYVKYVKKKEEYRVHLGILDINDPFNEAQHGISQPIRSEEHTSELQSLMRISYAVF